MDYAGCLVKLDGLLNLPRSAVTDNNHIWFQIPEHWVDALINDDETRLDVSAQELKGYRQFMYHFVETSDILSVGQSPYFSKHHDARPYGVLPCDVVDVKIGYDYDPC